MCRLYWLHCWQGWECIRALSAGCQEKHAGLQRLQKDMKPNH